MDSRDNGLIISLIATFLAGSRALGTVRGKQTDYRGCKRLLNSWGIHGPLMLPSIPFEERLLMYLSTELILLCDYAPKTALRKVRAYCNYESGFSTKVPKFATLADMIKGARYILQKPHIGRIILSPGAIKEFNGGLDTNHNILENALAGADARATGGCLRSSEYLTKTSLDQGRQEAQFLCFEKISDPYGLTLGSNNHKIILQRIMTWYSFKQDYF